MDKWGLLSAVNIRVVWWISNNKIYYVISVLRNNANKTANKVLKKLFKPNRRNYRKNK